MRSSILNVSLGNVPHFILNVFRRCPAAQAMDQIHRHGDVVRVTTGNREIAPLTKFYNSSPTIRVFYG